MPPRNNMELDIQVKGSEKAANRLDKLGRRARDSNAVFDDVYEALLQAERELWGKSRGWKQNLPSTLATDRSRGHDTKVNRNTGNLERSLTRRNDPNQIREVRGDSFRFGTKLFYAKWVHRGRGDNQIARPIIKLTPRNRRSIASVLQRHIAGSRNGHGRSLRD